MYEQVYFLHKTIDFYISTLSPYGKYCQHNGCLSLSATRKSFTGFLSLTIMYQQSSTYNRSMTMSLLETQSQIHPYKMVWGISNKSFNYLHVFLMRQRSYFLILKLIFFSIIHNLPAFSPLLFKEYVTVNTTISNIGTNLRSKENANNLYVRLVLSL